MSQHHPRHRVRIITGLATVITLGLAGLSACGSGPAAKPTPAPETTVLVKNKLLPTTSNRPPVTLKMPTSRSPKRP